MVEAEKYLRILLNIWTNSQWDGIEEAVGVGVVVFAVVDVAAAEVEEVAAAAEAASNATSVRPRA